MNRRTRIRISLACLGVIAVAALAAAGCGGGGLSGNLNISGSTTVLPIAQQAAEDFQAKNSGANVTVQGGGSSVGITNVAQGVSQIGDSSRELKDNEKSLGLVDHKIALDIITMIVNPGVTVNSLTTDQARGIFLGTIKNWSEVGGPNAPITVVIRDEASGTREMFDEKVLGKTSTNPVKPVSGALETNSNGIMRQKVASTKNSIGYISFGYLDKTVKPLQLNGVAGTLDNALNNTYPLSRYLHMFTKGEPTGLTKAYIDFVLSPAFQDSTVSREFIPMSKVKQ
ncbi:MAG: phosphate ABC transporter substrate-binding protein [Candidatus Geothermincolia bacterium]